MKGENRHFDCLEATRIARQEFRRSVIEHAKKFSAEKDPPVSLLREDIDLLSSNNAYTIAQFYYSAIQYRLSDAEKIRTFLGYHNEEMKRLQANKEDRDLLKLSISTLKGAEFSSLNINNVVRMNRSHQPGPFVLNQKYLGSLLIEDMSRESCRKVIVALGKFGLLERDAVGEVLIETKGILEGYFEKHLGVMVDYLGLQPVKPKKHIREGAAK